MFHKYKMLSKQRDRRRYKSKPFKIPLNVFLGIIHIKYGISSSVLRDFDVATYKEINKYISSIILINLSGSASMDSFRISFSDTGFQLKFKSDHRKPPFWLRLVLAASAMVWLLMTSMAGYKTAMRLSFIREAKGSAQPKTKIATT